jgi:hypothetical protein
MTVEQHQTAKRESVRLRGEAFVDKVKELLHEGNVRRLIIRNEAGHAVMEIPVTAGVIAAVLAPILAAVGAVAALANDWTIEVQHREPPAHDE